jgi:hypothetical protein
MKKPSLYEAAIEKAETVEKAYIRMRALYLANPCAETLNWMCYYMGLLNQADNAVLVEKHRKDEEEIRRIDSEEKRDNSALEFYRNFHFNAINQQLEDRLYKK